MKRIARWLVVAIVLSILAVGMVRWLQREPTYQGRTVTTSMLAAANCPHCDPNTIGPEKFEEVFRALGDESIPVLLRLLRHHEPSALEEWLTRWDDRFPWIEWRWTRRHNLPMVALAAFEILNTNATSAIPELSRRLQAGVSCGGGWRCR